MSRESELAEILRLHGEWLSSANSSGKRADLSGAQLDGIDLSGVDLSGALLRGASLRGAVLAKGIFFHADFSDADLNGADLSGASLVLANFSGADLRAANLASTHSQIDKDLGQNRLGPRFTDALMENANLDSAYCQGSDFSGATLKGARFSNANLDSADLRSNVLENLNFNGACLHSAKLTQAKLNNSNFQHADFNHASVSEAELSGADIRFANMQSANLKHCKVEGIRYNRSCLFRGVRVDGCYGSRRFKRFAEDQDYIEEFQVAHPIAYILWLSVTDCGRSMTRVALWSVTLCAFYALIFFLLGAGAFEIHNKAGLEWSFFSALYFSVVTFTTLGFGDITPNTSLAATVVIAEVLTGYLMLGIFISILATKVARRS